MYTILVIEPPADDDPEEWGEIAPGTPQRPSCAATAPLAREGSTIYTVRGADVYYSVGGSLPRVYCSVKNWPQSEAARRIAEPDRHGVALWDTERGEWGWAE